MNSGDELVAEVPVPSSPAPSEESDMSITSSSDSSTLCNGKRLLPGSNNPIKVGRVVYHCC